MIYKSRKGTTVTGVTHAIYLYSLLIVLVIALLVLAGWIFDIQSLTSLLPGTVSMKFNTALSFFLLAGTQLLSWFRKSKWIFTSTVMIVVLVHSILVLTEYLFNFSFGIDELLLKEIHPLPNDRYPGRMSPITAICFTLVCLGLLLQLYKYRKAHKTGQILLHLTTLISVVAILGYFTAAEELYTIADYTSIAMPTAISFLLLSIAGSMHYPELGLVGLLSKQGVGNAMARRQVPMITAGVFVLAIIRIMLERYKLVNEEFGIALFGLSMLLLALFIIFSTVGAINKLAADKLEAEASLLQNAVFIKEAPTAIAMFDTEMRYIAASNQWIQDYQLIEKNIVGQSHYDIFPEISEDWKQIHKECLAGAINKSEESVFLRKDGTMQWISWDVRPWHHANGEVAGIIMLTADLTKGKLEELEHRRVSTTLEQTSALSKIGTWEVDLIKHTVYWSSITKEIHDVTNDYQPELNSAINFFKEGESRTLITEMVQKAIDSGQNYDVELEIVTAKGKEKWVRAIGVTESFNNKVVRLYGIFQDLEKQKQYENELKDLLMLTTDQNRRLKNFAHIVSHNLRSHSGNIHMLLQRLIKKEPDLATKEIVQHILKSSSSLQETIANLSDIVIMNTSIGENMTLIPLKDMIDKCSSAITQQATDNAVTIYNEVPDHIYIKGVKAYTESILLNFLTNGIKYRSVDKSSYIKFTAEVSGKFLILSIEDNGLGIDLSKNGSKLFGMYKTFHGNADARGLGLFMSKNQLEAMGARVEVDSKPGYGTNFKLYFQQ